MKKARSLIFVLVVNIAVTPLKGQTEPHAFQPVESTSEEGRHVIEMSYLGAASVVLSLITSGENSKAKEQDPSSDTIYKSGVYYIPVSYHYHLHPSVSIGARASYFRFYNRAYGRHTVGIGPVFRLYLKTVFLEFHQSYMRSSMSVQDPTKITLIKANGFAVERDVFLGVRLDHKPHLKPSWSLWIKGGVTVSERASPVSYMDEDNMFEEWRPEGRVRGFVDIVSQINF